MDMDSLILLASGVSYLILSNWLLKKIFNIEEEKNSPVYVNETHKFLHRIIMIIGLFGGVLLAPKGIIAFYWVFSCTIILISVRGIMEWNDDRESKGYILYINLIITGVFIVAGFRLFIY